MVFSSLEFIFIFLPVFLLIYFLLPYRFKNNWLFIGSLVFYAYGALDNPLYILLMIGSILVNYLLGLAIQYFQQHRNLWLILGLIYNLGWLFVFKYSYFIFKSFNQIIAHIWPSSTFQLPLVNLLLPIGISFYTFQILSYLIDVYKGTIKAELSLVNLGAYLCMFPQLIAGPIVIYSPVSEQLRYRKYRLSLFDNGLKDFAIGLGLKVLLANQIGNLWSDISAIGYDSISTPLAWMGIISFSLQIYFDFFGYSLMAVGLGKMLGFQLPQNFDHPYLSLSMTEFWRKWHMTLGGWFREYVYIPLGGNRRGTLLTVRNLLIVWLLTGLWHGASWNFVLWGFTLFLLLIIEKLGPQRFFEKYKFLGHIYMILCIPLTWLIFAITDFSQLSIYFSRLFPFFRNTTVTVFKYDYLKYGKIYGMLLIVGIVFCTKVPGRAYKKVKNNIFGTAILLIVFWASIYCLYMGLNDPFLYFRF